MDFVERRRLMKWIALAVIVALGVLVPDVGLAIRVAFFAALGLLAIAIVLRAISRRQRGRTEKETVSQRRTKSL